MFLCHVKMDSYILSGRSGSFEEGEIIAICVQSMAPIVPFIPKELKNLLYNKIFNLLKSRKFNKPYGTHPAFTVFLYN